MLLLSLFINLMHALLNKSIKRVIYALHVSFGYCLHAVIIGSHIIALSLADYLECLSGFCMLAFAKKMTFKTNQHEALFVFMIRPSVHYLKRRKKMKRQQN